MCGIFGVSLNSLSKVSGGEFGAELFKQLMIENTERGKDATGVVYQYEGGLETYRALMKGSDAQNFVPYEHGIVGYLGHTRNATVGEKDRESNIHPFETDNYTSMHNGTVFNHMNLNSKFGFDMGGTTCDSATIVHLLETFGIKGLKYITGTFSLSFIDKYNPEEICLITNGSKPLSFVEIKNTCLAYGSKVEDLENKLKELSKQHGFSVFKFEAKPCHLYKVKDGKIISCEDMTDTIKEITRTEGKIQYLVDFKCGAKDFGQKLLCLPKPKQKEITSSTNSGIEDIYRKWLKRTSVSFALMYRGRIFGNYSAEDTIVDSGFLSSMFLKDINKEKNTALYHSMIKNGNQMVNRYFDSRNESELLVSGHLYSSNMLLNILALSEKIKIGIEYPSLSKKHLGNAMFGSLDFLLNTLLIPRYINGKNREELEEYINKTLISSGIIHAFTYDRTERKDVYNNYSSINRGLFINHPYHLAYYNANELATKDIFSKTMFENLAGPTEGPKKYIKMGLTGKMLAVIETLIKTVERMKLGKNTERMFGNIDFYDYNMIDSYSNKLYLNINDKEKFTELLNEIIVFLLDENPKYMNKFGDTHTSPSWVHSDLVKEFTKQTLSKGETSYEKLKTTPSIFTDGTGLAVLFKTQREGVTYIKRRIERALSLRGFLINGNIS